MTWQLNSLLHGLTKQQIVGPCIDTITGWTTHAQSVQPGNLFIAIRGTHHDGHNWIDEAITRGARVILCETLPPTQHPHVLYIQVPSTRLAWTHIVRQAYHKPDEHLTLVAVTGTNGKTTTVYLLWQSLHHLGYPSGMFSTIRYGWHNHWQDATLTTPDPNTFFPLLAKMQQHGIQYVFLEASSHSLAQHRLTSVRIQGAIFQNLSHDHLDYHGSIEAYRAAKFKLAQLTHPSGFLLANLDDPHGQHFLQAGKHVQHRAGFAIHNPAQFRTRIISAEPGSLTLALNNHWITLPLTGHFQAYNVLATWAALHYLLPTEDPIRKLEALSQCQPPPGRLEPVIHKPFYAFIDYAHTPHALQTVLTTLRQFKHNKLIVVIGCGGNRDTQKRPKMGAIATQLADLAIFTSDNPRNEDPLHIIQEMVKGAQPLNNYLIEPNRKQAIFLAVKLAQPNDILLIAGKGHETYQEIQGKKIPFSDKEVLLNAYHTLLKKSFTFTTR